MLKRTMKNFTPFRARGRAEHQSQAESVGGFRSVGARSRRGFGAGYTLVELIIAVGLFAVVMTLVAGAYIMMIGVSRQAQSIAAGIDNLAFALETMTRTIRVSTAYGCPDVLNCLAVNNTFAVGPDGDRITYTLEDDAGHGYITQERQGESAMRLTDSSIDIDDLEFYPTGLTAGDSEQARVTIVIRGKVSFGIDKTNPIPFTIETGATMRGTDL
jgi:type II secretory pathway pseudopilin PulG